MNLSEHFTLEEMTASSTAKAKGISNQPTEIHLKTLKHTCEYLLEPLRKLLAETYGCKVFISINSGYRSAKLNEAVKGSKTSQHLTGEAVDCRFYKNLDGKKTLISYLEVYNQIKTYVKTGKLSIDQCIYENPNPNSCWVHISHSASGKTKDRKQFMKYFGKGYILDKA